MKNFNTLNYQRPNYARIKTKITRLTTKLKNSTNYEEFLKHFKEIIKIQNLIEEMYDYIDIQNMRNLQFEFYNTEKTYWNNFKPKYDLLFIPFYELCLNTCYKLQLSKIVPPNFFNTIEYQLKISSNTISDLLTQEKELQQQYLKLMNKKVLYDGVEQNISSITKLFTDKDRNTRKKAHDTINNFYLEHQEQFDNIYFDLIKVRNSIAKKLGFNNYTTYSLYSLRRFGYNYNDINTFRDNIIKYIIPLCQKLDKLKKDKLNLTKLEYYDHNIGIFKEMPKPLFTGKNLLTNLKTSLEKIDLDLSQLYQDMLDNDYIDLETRDNKVNFAITNYLTTTCYPTITGNFKNNYLDIKTTTHELGHAYQKYNASLEDKSYIISSLLKYPTFEIAEMFSYAMELITMPNLSNIFSKQDHQKYCFMEIYNLLTSLPYICLIDEFQEQIYSKPNLTKQDIRTIWLNLTKKYYLETSNQGHPNLDNGGYFYRQSHLFMNPFYYIDYALSYIGALSIWTNSKDNINLFKQISRVASYYPLNILISKYNLPNPFNSKSIKNIANKLEEELNTYKL